MAHLTQTVTLFPKPLVLFLLWNTREWLGDCFREETPDFSSNSLCHRYQAMAVGQLFGQELYTVMSNAGMLVFIMTILLLMAEVDKDIVATNDIASFLVQVALKGDRTRMSTFTQPQPDLPCHDGEGKREDDDEHTPTVLSDIANNAPDFSCHDGDDREERKARNSSADGETISESLGCE